MPDFLDLYNILFFISIFSTILYIIKMLIFIFAGGDIEVEADFDSITETDIAFNFVSIQSMLAFLMGFGWSGLSALIQFGLGTVSVILISIAVGLFFMFLSAYIMFGIRKLNKNIKTDISELMGKTGRAYTSFTSKSEGQIEIVLNNKLSILTAINQSDEEIKAFSQIRVVKIEDKKIYIIKE